MERKTYLDRYRLCVDRIGIPIVIRRSAEEATLQADDLESGGQVALQLQPADTLGPADREQLAAEARAAQQLDHINIPVLRDFGFVEDKLLYVTEKIEGITAEDWIKTKGPMPASAVLRIASQVVSALGAASARGIFHYAVHPGNIMVVPGKTADGKWPLIKLLNLVGVAPPLPVPGTNGSVFLNPADFASPEQLADGTIDFRSEIYSLGCTLWFLLKGAPLIGGAAALPVANGLFAPVRQLLAEMLAENPAERPRDAASFQGQIQDCLAQIERRDAAAVTSGSSISPPQNKMESLPRRRSAWKPLALAALFLAVASLVVLILKQRPAQNFALKVSPARPTPSAFPSPTKPQPAEASPTEGTRESAILTASESVAPADKPQQASSDNGGPIEPAELAQVAPENVSASPPRIEMMASLPLEEEIMTEPAAVVASTSPEPVSAPAMEVALEQTPAAAEAPPPAEGPMESERPSAEVSIEQPPPLQMSEGEMPIDILIKPPRLVAKNSSKSEHTASAAAKKKSVEAESSTRRRPVYTPPIRPIPGTSVGHMLFPVAPKEPADEAAPAPSPRKTKKPLRSASR